MDEETLERIIQCHYVMGNFDKNSAYELPPNYPESLSVQKINSDMQILWFWNMIVFTGSE